MIHSTALIGCVGIIIGILIIRKFITSRRVVVIVIGASSAGKTSFARALINAAYPQKLFITTGIDDVFFALGNNTAMVTKNQWIDGEVNFIHTYDNEGHPIVDLSLGDVGARLSRITYDFAAKHLAYGLNVVIDEVLLNDDLLEYLLNQFAHHQVYIVCMTAPLEIREERERSRPNRFIGHTRSQTERAYQFKGHHLVTEGLCDLAFDSSITNTEEAVRKTIEHYTHSKPSALYKLLTLHHAENIESTPNHLEAIRARTHQRELESSPVMYLIIGASSAGKTTLAKKLINYWYPQKIFLSVGIDNIFRALGDETKPLRRNYWVNGEINYIKGIDLDGRPTLAVSLGTLGEDMMILAYKRAQELMNQGFNVIFDDIILSDRVFEYVLKNFNRSKVYLIGVHAPLALREQREIDRKNRPIGHTRTQEAVAYTYKGVNILRDELCDIMIDTSIEDNSESVERIASYIQTNQPWALKKILSMTDR